MNFWTELDGIIRTFYYSATDAQVTLLMQGRDAGRASDESIRLESLEARGLRKLGRPDAIPHDGGRIIRFGPNDA
ncbi:hypothetical protein BH18VER1_BH18VER1_01270 [soil metagenome]